MAGMRWGLGRWGVGKWASRKPASKADNLIRLVCGLIIGTFIATVVMSFVLA